MRHIIAVPLLLAAAGCAGSGGFVEEFAEACTDASNLDAEVCDCMAEKAEEELTEDERAFVLASLREDQDRAAELREELGMTSAIRAGMFMTNVATCAVEQSEP